MFSYKKAGALIEVRGWDSYRGDDDVKIGVISQDGDGFYWFEPSDVMLCYKEMSSIAEKLKDLNS